MVYGDHGKLLGFYSWCSGKPLSNYYHLNAVWKRVGRKLKMRKENQQVNLCSTSGER